MRSARLVHLKDERGSAVVGFSLVAPLIALVFVGIVGVAAILGQRLVLGAAASSSARMAATLGATQGQARQQSDQVLTSYSINPQDVSFRIWRGSQAGAPAVFVRLTKTMWIPWVNQQIVLEATSHRIDENS